jgi:hypothetical protein
VVVASGNGTSDVMIDRPHSSLAPHRPRPGPGLVVSAETVHAQEEEEEQQGRRAGFVPSLAKGLKTTHTEGGGTEGSRTGLQVHDRRHDETLRTSRNWIGRLAFRASESEMNGRQTPRTGAGSNCVRIGRTYSISDRLF